MTKTLKATALKSLLAITQHELDGLIKAGIPVNTETKTPTYPTLDCVKWYINYLKSSEDETNHRERKTRFEADLLEIDLQLKEGSVVPIEDVTSLIADDYARVRALLLSLPSKITPMIVGSDAPTTKETLRSQIIEILEELTADAAYRDE